jgi:hypothetical protein
MLSLGASENFFTLSNWSLCDVLVSSRRGGSHHGQGWIRQRDIVQFGSLT